ncbi:MAG: Wzz/FepE/Etk N-terminal domain-containing protein [Thermoleophilia bacterium]|nr:Wzz/FepE/Etk N-terminal domain-containing protein [Thermoleophilia bacterium]
MLCLLMETRDPSSDVLETVELSDYLKVVRERKWIIVLCVAAVTAAALVGSFLTTPRYKATAGVLYKQNNFDVLFNAQIFEVRDLPRELQTGANLVKVSTVAEMVQRALDSPRAPEELLPMVEVQPEGQTNLINITASSIYAQEAADLANAFATQFVVYRRDADRMALQTASKQLEEERQQLQGEQADAYRLNLIEENMKKLQILESMQTGGYEVVQQAEVPLSPFTPQPVRNGVLALAVGLVLGVGLAFLLEYLDRRIKDEETLEREFGLPVLASVPLVGKKWAREQGQRSLAPVGFLRSHSPLLEPYRLLRSNLQYFEVDRTMRSILITSALPEEGKTITSINLGLSLAFSGSRVVILEADLRKPRLHSYLNLGNEIGVSNVLAGTHTFAESMQLVQVDEFAPPESRRSTKTAPDSALLQKNLYCVTSGPLPPNPAELVGSAKMFELIEKATDMADYVIVDTPPLLAVSDSLNLASHVDGVIVSARMNSTTIDEAREVRTLLQRVGGRPIGVVANGVKKSRRYYYRKYRYGRYYSGYGYGEY